jgi:phosphatidylserine decarboxylase
MRIHKEGYKTLRNEVIILLAINYIIYLLFNQTSEYVLIFSFIILALSIYFFRVPKRTFVKDNQTVYSPCDGKVVVIEETLEGEYYKDNRIQISIFMSPLNIHNNLFPISGKIIYEKYHPGKYLFAWNPKSSTDNERNTIVIENNKISILCRQIAGALARRIISYTHLNKIVNTSEELGFIKFGSRVDLFLPNDSIINVKIGDKVKGGKSIISRLE